MPTYEFRCPQGHEFEKFYRSIGTAEAQTACPVCGQPSERMMSAPGFAFKGSGFYLTDYGKNAHREKGTPTNGSAPAGDSAKPVAAESKPESSAKSEAPSVAPAESKKSTAAPAEAKPAAAPKKSTGE